MKCKTKNCKERQLDGWYYCETHLQQENMKEMESLLQYNSKEDY